MDRREDLELLCSRSLDEALSEQDHARLEHALAADAQLREFMDSLRRSDELLNELSKHYRLPADFTEHVRFGVGARVIPGPTGSRMLWAAAAAVVLFFGVGIGSLVWHSMQQGPDYGPQFATARVQAFSAGPMEVLDAAGISTVERELDASIRVPATLTAPANTHVVVQLGGATAVLAPGASVRLSAAGADGQPGLELVSGDLFLDSWGRSRVESRVRDVQVSLNTGGLVLRGDNGVYTAAPAYGDARAGSLSFGQGQCARIEAGVVSLVACDAPVLEDWIINGRADAIKHELRSVLGKHYDEITPEQWQRGERVLHAVLARPADRAALAGWLRMLIRHGFFDDSTESELQAWGRIADILAEGTSLHDVPENQQRMMRMLEAAIERQPEKVAEFRTRAREMLERMEERKQERKRNRPQIPTD